MTNANHNHLKMVNSVREQEAALWQCDHCKAWWCSQPEVQPTTFMLQLPTDTLELLGWENFRGWRLGGTPHVATCPDCDTVALDPLFGAATTGHQLQLDLAALLRPALAPAG